MGEWEPNWIHALEDGEVGSPFPGDFSEEEAAFAAEMRDLFPVEQEELPPLYVTTLVGNDLYTPLAAGFEQKLSYRVFQRLCLPRLPLFGQVRRRWPTRPTWPALLDVLAQTSRPVLGAMSAALLVMALTVALALLVPAYAVFAA
nr:hypothetical protein [Ktedonobacterales bacterium]